MEKARQDGCGVQNLEKLENNRRWLQFGEHLGQASLPGFLRGGRVVCAIEARRGLPLGLGRREGAERLTSSNDTLRPERCP